MTLLGIDLGTSNLKVATFSNHGELIEQRIAPIREHVDGTARWQDADEWWTQAIGLIRAIQPERVDGVALSGRANAGVFLDASLNVVAHPWSDPRHRDDLAAVTRSSPSLSTYGAALVSKVRWLRRHHPELLRKTRYAAYGKDLFYLRLTGQHRTDWSSGPDGPAWQSVDPATLNLLPRPALPSDVSGTVQSDAARATGLRAGIPVAVGAHDGVCANVGVGATGADAWALTLGTHAVVRTIVAGPHPFRFYVMPPDRQVIGRTTLAAGRAIDWWCRVAGRDRTALLSAAREVPPGARGAKFLPYLHGQIAPRLARDRRGHLTGLSDQHDGATLLRAIIEGVSFGIASCADALARTTPRPTTISITGGGIHNPLWLEILANVLECPLELGDPAVEARGACVFLAAGLGHYPSVEVAAATMRRITERLEPTSSATHTYRTVRADWETAEADDYATD